MALFKIAKGNSADLEVNRPQRQEGFIYLTQDDMKFYIDTGTGTEAGMRKPLNASRADLLKAWYTSPADVAGRWTTTIPGISEDNLVDGLTIRIRLGTSYNNSYNTLNINGLGPKLVYYRQNELLTNHVAQYAEVLLTYRTKHVEVINGTSYSIPGANTSDITKDNYHYGYDGWVLDASYSDGNDYDRLQMKYERARIGDVALKQYKFCMFDENGHLYPISTGSGTSGHEPVTVGLKPNRILYLNSSTTNYANAYAVTKDGDLYESLPINKLLYTFNSNIPAYSQLYLVGSIGNNGLFYLNQEDADSFYIYVTPPSDGPIPLNTFTAGKYYIFVGASSGTAGNFQLSTSHTLYYCADASEGRTLTPVLSTTNVIATNIGALYTDAANKTAQWGTLPVAYGGTGMTSNPSMRINLSSTSATNVFQSSPKPGVEGILSVANGGTGKATLDSGKALIGNGADAVTLRNIYTKTAAGTLDWASASNEYLVTKGAIAYWNGAYAGTSSNIIYVSTIKGGTWQGSTVGIAYGGTGMTSNPSMRINLSSTSAANVFQASPKPGVEGILGINNGGTGGASANAAIKNLALGLDAATDDVTDSTVFIGSKNAVTQTDTWYRRTGLQFWNYIKGKTDAAYAAKSYEDIVDDMKNVSIGINTDTSGASGPTITISTGQYTATSAPITSATTSLFGVTKLSSAVNSSSETLAATAKAVKTAYDKAVSVEAKVNNLDVADTADSTKYVSEVDQTDGKIAVTRAAFNPSVSLGDGTDSAGPTIAISVAGNSTAATPIPKATTAKHGVTILTSTVDTTTETKAVTPKGVSAAITDLDLPNTYLKLNGTNNMGADVNIIAGDTDKFVNFWYNTNRTAGASWRLGMLGSGTSNTNYFVIQSGTSTTSNTVWQNALRIGQNNLDIQFSGHVTPSGLSLDLGSESYPWKNVYGETFHGNATTASKFNSTRKIELTGAVTGSDTKDGSSGWTIATTAKYLDLYEARGTTSTLNKAANYGKAGAMFHLVASSSTGMTDNGKPPAGDANVLQMNWDNNGGYDAQLAISTADSRMEFRSRASQKTAWREVVTVPAATPATGSGLTPVYINSSGQVVSCDTSLLTLGTTATTAAAGNHTHSYLSSISWASSSNKIQQSVNGGTATDVLQFVAGGGTTLTGAAGKLTITSYRDPGFGVITVGAASTSDAELEANTISLSAKTYNETFAIKPANKWIVLAGTNSNTANADILEIAHSLSGATAGSYGNSANQTPAYGGTFNVPYITVDAGGHITSVSNTTVKIPASDNVDNKVAQTATTTNAAYEILFSNTADNTTRTEGARKTSTLTYNPSTKALVTGGTVDGYDLNAASAKGVDTSMTAASTSTNLPTTAAVAALIASLDFTSIGVAAATGNRFVSQISQADGKISAAISTATIGSSHEPVYVDAGTIKQAIGHTIEYIVGTQTAATGSWTGVTEDSALYVGKMIAYRLPYAGSGNATLTLTLADGTTTNAYPVFAGNTRLTTHYPANTIMIMVWNGTDWRTNAFYDTNSNTLLRVYSSATDIEVPLIAQSSANSVTANWASYTGTYKDWYGAIPNDDDLRAKINLSTGHITAPGGITSNLIGNATTATTLQTARTINGTSFNGSANITTVNWGTARDIHIADSDASNTGAAVSVNGSANVTLKLPATIKATLKGHADTATSLTDFVVSSYTLAAGKAVRIKYPTQSPVLISVQRSNSCGRLILIGGGYGAGGGTRNDFTEVVSPNESSFTWSLPNSDSISSSIEIMNVNTSGTAAVMVWAKDACTFTQVDALLTTKQNRVLLHSSNYTNYTVTKTGSGASGTWGISVSGNAATATKFASAQSVTLTGDVTGTASSQAGWSIATTIGAGKVTNAMLAGSIANAKLANSSITIAGNSVALGGSLAADTLRASLGLSSAMHFIGKATVAITDGSTTDPAISGYTTKATGDVIIDKDNSYEYVWTAEGKWERLGPDGSYSLSTHTHGNITNNGQLGTASRAVVTDANKNITVADLTVNNPTDASSEAISFIDTISQNSQGKITPTRKSVRVATASASGVVSTTAQTFAGVKTFNDIVKLKANQYADTAGTGSLDLQNSDIYGVNSIKFTDLADAAAEGLQWYRSSTTVDSFWVKNGVMYFTPNRAWGSTATNYTVWHSGNFSPTWQGWADGTTAGPVGKIGFTSSLSVTFSAIPTATAEKSGIVTIDTQSFKGAKDFQTAIGKDRFILYPDGGNLTKDGTQTGAIMIKLPVKWTNTMIKFVVSIYNYVTNQSVDYHIAGYNYSGGGGSWVNCTAFAVARGDNAKANLTVRFGDDTVNTYISIGELDTSWSYPKVQIHDLVIGHSGVSFTTWSKSWDVSFVTAWPTDQNHASIEISHTNVNYGSNAEWITSGTLPIAHGGTGKTTAADAWTALGGGASGKHADTFFVKAITSTDNAIVRYDGTSGQIQNSSITINDSGVMATSASINMTKAGEIGIEVDNTQSTNPNKVAFIVGSSGNGGIYSRKHNKWIVYADASGNVVLNGNANTATKAGVANMWLYPENNNELNFGGTNNSTTIYFGYRAKDSRAIPTKFVFGSSTGTADIQVKTVYLGSGTSSYISSTQYTGNAATATKWAAAQKVYVTLGTASTTTTIQGGSTSAQTIGVDGTLGVAHGGTGATSFAANSVIMSGSSTTAALTTRTVTNNTTNTAIAANTNIPTMNTIYYGLAVINNASQTRGVSIYAPTTGGTANTQALVGNGATTAPKWVNISPSITITAGTGSATPQINVTVLGQSGSAQSITTASTSVYGCTKLQDGIDSTSTALAATAKAAYTASRNVLQTGATAAGTFPILYKNAANVNDETAQVKFNDVALTNGKATTLNPNTGEMAVGQLKVFQKVTLEYNATDDSLDFVWA